MTGSLLETSPAVEHFVCVLANGAQLLPFHHKSTESPDWHFSTVLREGMQEVTSRIRELVAPTGEPGGDPVTDLAVFRTWADNFARPKMISELRKLRSQLVHIPPLDRKHHFASTEAIDQAIVEAAADWVRSMNSRHVGALLSLVIVGLGRKAAGRLSSDGVTVFPVEVVLNAPTTSCGPLVAGSVSQLMLAGSPWKPRTGKQAST